MYLAPYNVAQIPTRYRPLWLRTENINAICSFIFQLKVDYAIRQLTAIPVPIEEIDFTWEQLEGSPPLEVSDWNVAQPIVTLNPELKDDLKFRVYMDKGKKTEMSADLWIYRTPTEFSHTRIELDMVEYDLPLKVKSGEYSVKPALKPYLPNEIELDYGYEIAPGVLADNYSFDEINVYTAHFNYGGIYDTTRSVVNYIDIFDASTGNLVSRSSDPNNVNIPLTVKVFYYAINVTLFKNHGRFKPINEVIYGSKVISTLFREYTSGNAQYYGVTDNLNRIGISTASEYYMLGSIRNTSYPVSMSYFAKLNKISILLDTTSRGISKRLLKNKQETPNNEKLAVMGIPTTSLIKSKNTIVRYNGITIGG